MTDFRVIIISICRHYSTFYVCQFSRKTAWASTIGLHKWRLALSSYIYYWCLLMCFCPAMNRSIVCRFVHATALWSFIEWPGATHNKISCVLPEIFIRLAHDSNTCGITCDWVTTTGERNLFLLTELEGLFVRTG